MTPTSLLLYAFALALTAGSPGPSVAALTARVLARGWRSVLPFAAAMWIGEAIWLTLAVLGLGVVAQRFAELLLVLKIAGVAYLLILAWKMWHAPVALAHGQAPPDTSPLRMFLAGFAVTMGNPKIMVFYMALLPAVIDLAKVSVGGWAELTAVMLVTLVCVDGGYMVLAAQARRLLCSPAAIRLANRISAGTMAGAAALIAAESA